MAARFPQSTTSVAYRIKPAWASKIHVLYWAADADKLHRLRSGDAATTIITRAATGAGFDATNGVITGSITTYFQDSIAGGYGATQENGNWSAVIGYYGDCFSAFGAIAGIASSTPPKPSGGFSLGFDSYRPNFCFFNNNTGAGGAQSDDVADWMTIGVRNDQADTPYKQRAWINGTRQDYADYQTNYSTANTSLIGDTARPLYLAATYTGSGNTKQHFEFAAFCAALSDADMATITSDPASVIELAGSPPAAPTIGTTTAISNTGATINWTDNSADETGFKVEWSPSPYSTWTAASNSPAAANATSLAITGLTAATTYKARVAATNANGDSAWVETATFTTTNTVKKLKLKIDASAAGATGISGVVWAAQVGAIAGAEIGEFTGQAFEAALEGGQAVLKVPVSAFGGGSLTTSDTPVALVRNATNTSGIVSCTVIEE